MNFIKLQAIFGLSLLHPSLCVFNFGVCMLGEGRERLGVCSFGGRWFGVLFWMEVLKSQLFLLTIYALNCLIKMIPLILFEGIENNRSRGIGIGKLEISRYHKWHVSA